MQLAVEPGLVEVEPPRMVQAARLAPGHSTWLPEVRSQKKLAPGLRSFPEPVEWAGETQKRVLLRARAGRRAPLFPGDLAWPLPAWARRIQAQRLQSIEQARVEAWQPVVEQGAQLAQCEQELFLRR